jgi:hypothetical protein
MVGVVTVTSDSRHVMVMPDAVLFRALFDVLGRVISSVNFTSLFAGAMCSLCVRSAGKKELYYFYYRST